MPSASKNGHGLYTPSSAAKKLNGSSWTIGYGDGTSAGGDVYIDEVTVGGVTATSQAVQAANTVSPPLVDDTNFDGILGLSFSGMNTGKYTAFLLSIITPLKKNIHPIWDHIFLLLFLRSNRLIYVSIKFYSCRFKS